MLHTFETKKENIDEIALGKVTLLKEEVLNEKLFNLLPPILDNNKSEVDVEFLGNICLIPVILLQLIISVIKKIELRNGNNNRINLKEIGKIIFHNPPSFNSGDLIRIIMGRSIKGKDIIYSVNIPGVCTAENMVFSEVDVRGNILSEAQIIDTAISTIERVLTENYSRKKGEVVEINNLLFEDVFVKTGGTLECIAKCRVTNKKDLSGEAFIYVHNEKILSIENIKMKGVFSRSIIFASVLPIFSPFY